MGLVQGGLSKLMYGGGFETAFLDTFAGSALGAIGVKVKDQVFQTVKAAVIGGTVSEIGGGKFANGAAYAAFSYAVASANSGNQNPNGLGSQQGQASQQQGPNAQSGGFLSGALDVIGKIWNVPNTIIGLAYGGVGHVAGLIMGTNPRISFGNNAIQFHNNPFTQTATALGNVVIYRGKVIDSAGVTWDYSPNSTLNGYAPTGLGNEEMQHTFQGQALGPLYLPAHGVLGVAAMLRSGQFNSAGWHSSTNFLETCPHAPNPAPWGC